MWWLTSVNERYLQNCQTFVLDREITLLLGIVKLFFYSYFGVFLLIQSYELSVPDNSSNKLCTHFVLTAKIGI